MKKLIAGAMTASALTFGGLAAVSVAPASAADYPVQPATAVKQTEAGDKFVIKFDSGVVGLPTKGKVRWVYVKTPDGFNKNGDRKVKTHKLKQSGLSFNKHGKAFPVAGTYVIRFTVVGTGETFLVTVKAK